MIKRSRFPWTEIALVLLGLLVAELGIRAASSAQLLPSPEPYLWHRPEVYAKLEQMHALEHKARIEVLFVGSSVAYMGVSPLAFDSGVESRTGLVPHSYNAGLAALPVPIVTLFVERVFLAQVSPKSIIYLVSPRDFNQNAPTNKALTREVMSSVYGQAMLGTGPKAALSDFLVKHSSLYRYRSPIWIAVLNGFSVPQELPSAYNDPQFDTRGYSPGYHKLPSSLSDAQGQTPRNDKAVVALANYDPYGSNIASLENLIRVCESAGIRLVLVSVPLTQYYRASFENPDTDYQSYLDAITGLAQEFKVPFWDMNRPPFQNHFSDADFHDVFHLNDDGAGKLAEILAQIYVEN
jgi:hypothetical protein